MGQANIEVPVTGGAGYIGTHALKKLARGGYQPIVYDHMQTGHREAVKLIKNKISSPLVGGEEREGDK